MKASATLYVIKVEIRFFNNLFDHQAFCRIVEDSLKTVADYKKTIESGSVIPSFGQKADEVCNAAIERFAQEAALPEDSKPFENFYDKKVDDLEKVLDSPLHVVYLKQLSLLREKALKSFKSSIAAAPESANDYEFISQVAPQSESRD